MADFCMQCSVHYFERDTGDLAGQVTPEDVAAGFGALAICEGCGFTIVDDKGACMTDCLEHHASGAVSYYQGAAT